ncbi:MAG: hypothetical protein ABI685_13885 [Ferruginibacter sp.]
MKKQYQWVILTLFACFFCCTNQDNNLKACGTNTTACAAIKTTVLKEVKDIITGYDKETDGAVYMLKDPFIYSN